MTLAPVASVVIRHCTDKPDILNIYDVYETNHRHLKMSMRQTKGNQKYELHPVLHITNVVGIVQGTDRS